jgi:hypothetical protein
MRGGEKTPAKPSVSCNDALPAWFSFFLGSGFQRPRKRAEKNGALLVPPTLAKSTEILGTNAVTEKRNP